VGLACGDAVDHHVDRVHAALAVSAGSVALALALGAGISAVLLRREASETYQYRFGHDPLYERLEKVIAPWSLLVLRRSVSHADLDSLLAPGGP
jgi:hypothetical protein